MVSLTPGNTLPNVEILLASDAGCIGRTDAGIVFTFADGGNDAGRAFINANLRDLGHTGMREQVAWYDDGAELWLIAQ